MDYLVLGKETDKEIIIEKQGKMNAWEVLADYWWLVFPVGAFLYGLFAAAMKVL